MDMPSPQIPNLRDRLTSDSSTRGHGSGGGLRGLAARRAGHSSSTRGPPSNVSPDTAVQTTDDDAARFRLAALNAGCLPVDAAAAPLARWPASEPAPRCLPMINRGTYVRTSAVDALVDEFVAAHAGRVQVLSLGAGSDSRFWRFVETRGAAFARRVRWCEVDFKERARRKIEVIRGNASVRAAVEKAARLAKGEDGDRTPTRTRDAREDGDVAVAEDGCSLRSAAYAIYGLDLRTLATEPLPDPALVLPDLDPDWPTLLLSECCLTYIESATTSAVLSFLVGKVLGPSTPVRAVLFEPQHPHDRFGAQMIANLLGRDIALPGVEACPTFEKHAERLKAAGFADTKGCSMLEWWKHRVDASEKTRLRRAAPLDEEEEWELMAGHYLFIWSERKPAA